jgi:tetratricopeptide (TPR) repeat protein
VIAPVACTALLLAAGPAAPPSYLVSPEYEAVVRLYASGRWDEAVSRVAQLRPSVLDQQIRGLQRVAKDAARCPSCPDPLQGFPLMAAAMLHFDRDEADRPEASGTEQIRLCPADHARRAGQLAALLASREPGRDFARRFFLATAQRAQWDFCLEAAVASARDGLERFPKDPDLLLTLGAALEERATALAAYASAPATGRGGTQDGADDLAAERRRRFGAARRALTDAVAVSPDSTEPRVRLGRVLWWLEDDEGALQALGAATDRGSAYFVHLAHLFRGQIQERAGRLDEAMREFDEALATLPDSQAAAFALSHATLMAGDRQRALRILEGALGNAGTRNDRDPYWDYLAGNARGARILVDGLRGEASQ